MTPDQIAARLRTLRDRTGDAVQLASEVWLYPHASACEPVLWQVWIGAHWTHYTGPTADAALTAAENACLCARAGEDT